MSATQQTPDPKRRHFFAFLWLSAVSGAVVGGCSRAVTAQSAPTATASTSPPRATVVQSTALVGICEPSGAALAPDGSLWIADDDQDHVLFRWNPSGGRPEAVAIAPVDDKAPVQDMEGLAWKENTLWVLGSHSKNRKGKLKRRNRLGSWTPGSDATLQHSSLWPDKKADEPTPIVAGITQHCPSCAPKTPWSTLNLEGLTWAPSGGPLWVGARSPVDRDGSAYVFGIQPQPAPDGVPGVSAVSRLDLGGRGVRALSPAPNHPALLILAGPATDADPADGQFALYRWTSDQEPELLALLPALDGSPEALLAIDATRAVVLVDEGDRLKRLSEQGPGSPHRAETEDGPEFVCGAGSPSDDTANWAHAVHLRWDAAVSEPPSIR